MRIFFLTQWYPSPESPINGVFIREHARAISLYHQVYVVFVKGLHQLRDDNQSSSTAEDSTLVEKTITYHKPSIPKTTWNLRIRRVFHFFDELSASGNRPNLVHANVYNTVDLAAMLSRRYHIPAVLTEHATTFPRRQFTRIQALKIRVFMNMLQMVMPVSQDLIQHMRYYGIHGPFRAIPNTVDTRIFKPGETKPSFRDGIPRILVVANLIQIKGVDLLLKSLAILKDQGREFQLMVVGDGPERNKLTELALQLNLTAVTTFYGLRDRNEVAGLMKTADMLALTSLWENQPVVILEALASGLPVLSSRIAGIPEVLTPMCGRMVEPGDIYSICENLKLLLDNLNQYPANDIAHYARSKFSYQAVGNAFSEAYQQVIEEYYRA